MTLLERNWNWLPCRKHNGKHFQCCQCLEQYDAYKQGCQCDWKSQWVIKSCLKTNLVAKICINVYLKCIVLLVWNLVTWYGDNASAHLLMLDSKLSSSVSKINNTTCHFNDKLQSVNPLWLRPCHTQKLSKAPQLIQSSYKRFLVF